MDKGLYKGKTRIERFYDYLIDTLEAKIVWFDGDKEEIKQAIKELKNDKEIEIYRFKQYLDKEKNEILHSTRPI